AELECQPEANLELAWREGITKTLSGHTKAATLLWRQIEIALRIGWEEPVNLTDIDPIEQVEDFDKTLDKIMLSYRYSALQAQVDVCKPGRDTYVAPKSCGPIARRAAVP